MAFSLPVANEIIATISFVLCVILIIWAWNSFSAGKAWLSSVIAVVMLSASSNIFDRIYWQGVIDFIAIRIGPIHWSIFNVADMGIVVGLLLIILLTTYPQINRKSTN
jgi:signal peptidase II